MTVGSQYRVSKKQVIEMKTPMRAIKAHCIECMGSVKSEVKFCTSPNCNLYQYRLGKNPNAKGRAGGNPENLRRYHQKQKNTGILLGI